MYLQHCRILPGRVINVTLDLNKLNEYGFLGTTPDHVLIRQNPMGILNHCCCCGCSYNLNTQNRNISPSGLENVSYQDQHLKLARTTSSQTLSHPTGLRIFSRNDQIGVAFQLPSTQLITCRDGIWTLINAFILPIKENTACELRQHRQMENSVCGRNIAIYPSNAKSSRQDIWHTLTENEF